MMTAFNLISLNMRMATQDDHHLPAYDHTKLSNINTCPTWGILRYTHHKRMPGSVRQMPLEAGAATHEAFSAIRWYQYWKYQCHDHIQYYNAEYHGNRLFGAERFIQMRNTISETATDRTNVINFALEALESTGFYDDPTDRNRTISNISESLIAYIDQYNMERYPIWVRDTGDKETDIGIEIPFDIVVDIKYDGGSDVHDDESHLTARFTGKLDGLQYNKEHLIIIEEKTGSNLNDHWLAQWILSHQITGYCLASTTFTGLDCNQAMVSGTRLPIGRVPHEGIRKEVVNRHPLMYEKWANWFVNTIEIENKWKDNILDAPMYTHSCNRYFRTCSFLPLCAADNMKEKELILEEMELDEWSPLHD
jgi:hypothetical protein